VNTADLENIETPCFVCDLDRLQHNLDIFAHIQEETGCEILLALKCFAMHAAFPFIRRVLAGAAASSLHEAELGFEGFGKKVHLYAVAYKEAQFSRLLDLSSHIVFNSWSQWERFGSLAQRRSDINLGLRINPRYSEVEKPIYDSCRFPSRLGITRATLDGHDLSGISGLHFHSHTQNFPDALERTLEVVARDFGSVLEQCGWLNIGGGQQITDPTYDVDHLIHLIDHYQQRLGLRMFLEPGESVVLNSGYLVTTVLDIVHDGIDIAVLDCSATAHMPLVVEEPYAPPVVGARKGRGYHPFDYQLGGLSCLASDIIGTYSFPHKLAPGDKILIDDMMPYTMVRNTPFNGIDLPSLALWSEAKGLQMVRKFGLDDYRDRLS